MRVSTRGFVLHNRNRSIPFQGEKIRKLGPWEEIVFVFQTSWIQRLSNLKHSFFIVTTPFHSKLILIWNGIDYSYLIPFQTHYCLIPFLSDSIPSNQTEPKDLYLEMVHGYQLSKCSSSSLCKQLGRHHLLKKHYPIL